MSIRGGASMAIERARSIGCTAMQVFVKNNMQWFARPLTREEIRAFLNHVQRGELLSVFGHANYLINLAATNPQFHANSIRALAEELVRADQLELPFLVLHPGAHLGAGEEAGLKKIADSVDEVFRKIPKVKTKIALEITAGQGSCIGHRFEHLAHIIANVREPERLRVCLDTAHLFAAGYDISSESGVKKTFHEFDRVIGRDRLVAIHVNDSKTGRGSRVDRHEHIGKGRIGLDAFRFIMQSPRFRKIPKVLETPKGKDLAEDVINLKTLRRLANQRLGQGVILSGAKWSRRIPQALAESNSPGSLDFARDDGAELFDQPDRERIPIELSFAGLNRCDDDQHGVRHPERYQDWNSDQEDAENRGDRVVNQHRDLEIERFLSVRVDLRGVAAFYQPDSKRAENVTQKVKEQSEQCAGVAQDAPRSNVRGSGWSRRRL